MKNKNLDLAIHSFLLLLPFVNLALFLKGVYDFEWLAVIYAINLLLLFPVFIIDWRKKQFTGYWVFSLTFFYSLPWIVFGFDMTDESYSLTVAWFFPEVKALVAQKAPVSYLLTHLWLKALGDPYYLWERIVVNIVLSLILYLSYKTAKNFSNELSGKWLATIIIFFAFGVLSYNWYRYLVPYDKLPVLLTIIFLYLWFVGIKRKDKSLVFLSGIFLALAMYSRITNFFLLPLLPIASVIHRRYRNKYLFFAFYGLIAGFIIITLSHINLTRYITENISILKPSENQGLCVTLDTSHRPDNLISLYIVDLKRLLPFLITFSILLGFFQFVSTKQKGKKYSELIISFALLAIYVIIFNFFHFPHKYFTWFYTTAGVYGALIFIAIILKPKIFVKEWDFIFALLLIAAISFAGSNAGARKIHFNFAVAFIVPIFLILVFEKLNKPMLYTSLFFIALMGFWLNVRYVYRDYSLIRINDYFKTDITRGLWTRTPKIQETTTFSQEIKTLLKNNNFITINKTYFFALANDKRPASICWSVSPEGLRKVINQEKLHYVVFSNRSMRFYQWDEKAPLAISWDLERVKVIKQILDKHGSIIASSPHNIFVLYEIKKSANQKQGQ